MGVGATGSSISAFIEQASLSAGSLNADLVPSLDVSGYKWLSLQIAGTFVGTLNFSASNDGVTWGACSLSKLSNGSIANQASAIGIWAGPVQFRYLRVRMTAYTSGTATGTLELYTSPPGNIGVLANQFGTTWVVQLQDGSSNNITSSGGALNVIPLDYTTTGTISADQGAVTATFGTGIASWTAYLAGTFNAGTTIFFEGTIDGTNWIAINGALVGATSDTDVSSVVGGASVAYQGNASGMAKVRMRAHPFAGGDSVTVTIIGSVSVDGGFLTKSLPAGTASIGAVTANAGTNLNTSLLALEGGGNLATLAGAIASSVMQDNLKQVGGTATDTNSGVKSAGTLRVVLATDQPALTNKLLVTPDSVALPANQSVNAAQVAGTTTSVNAGTVDAGTQRVSLATDQKVPTKAASGDFVAGSIADLAPLTTAQGATLGSQQGPMVQASVTSSPPTYTTGQISPLSQTTAGALRVTPIIAGGASPAGNGATTSSTQRVTIANDSTGIIGQGAGAAAGTSWRTQGDFTEQASLSAGSLNADLVASTDVSAFKGIGLHVINTAYSGTLTFQCSNDNSNWVSLNMYLADNSNGPASSTSNTNKLYYSPVFFRYFRCRMTAYTSGTANGVFEQYTFTVPSGSFSQVTAVETGTWTVQPGNTQNTTPWLTQSAPSTSGGTTNFHRVSTADTNQTNIKASVGQVYGYDIANTNAAWRYVKLHNTAGAPTAGTGVVRTIAVPPGGKATYFNDEGIPFATGIAMSAVTGAADSDATAVGAADLLIEIDYK